MSPRRKSQPAEPPRPPTIARRISLDPVQIVGMGFLALVVILAGTGVLVESGAARESIWRVTFVYVFLMVAFRLSGKREVGQMSPFELVTLLLIPEIFSSAVNRSDDSIGLATTGVATLFLLVFLTGVLTFRSQKAEDLIEGKPTVLVRNGAYVADNMRRERVTPEEIATEMRLAGVERLEDVAWAILETEGKIAIIPSKGSGPEEQKKAPEEGG